MAGVSATVHGINLVRILCLHQFPLELHGRGEFLVLGRELGVEQPKLFDLLHPGELGIGLVHHRLNQGLHLWALGQAGIVAERNIMVLGKFLDIVLVDHDDRGEVRFLIAH